MALQGKKTFIGLIMALVVGALLCLGMLRTGFQPFVEGYFYGALLAVSVAVGALGIRLVYALTGGRWGVPLERYFVSASRTMPWALLLWLPVLFWLGRLFPWARPELVASDPLLAHKAPYLNVPFFIVRAVAYFVLWTAAVWWLDRRNARTDLSGLLAVVYFFAASFAAIDWVMSLQPRWFSTIFAAAFVTGQVLLAFCAVIVAQGGRAVSSFERDRVAPGGFIDQGSLILTMVLFYAYLAFSQFLIIWMGNKPKEVSWYLAHTAPGWHFMPAVIIVGHLFLPFFLLLDRSWKTSTTYLAAVALLVLVMRAADIGWSVFSGLSRPPGTLTITHAGAALVVVSVYLMAWAWQTGRYKENVP